MDLNNPHLDFGLEQELLVNALKGHQSDMNVNAPQWSKGAGIAQAIQRAVGTYNSDKTQQQMRDLSQEERRRVAGLSEQIATPGTRQRSVLSQTLGEGQMGPEQETVQQVPLSPVEENQRQLKLALEMMQLPSGRAAATQFVNSGVAFPERWAEAERDDANMRARGEDARSFQTERDAASRDFTREQWDRQERMARQAAARSAGGGRPTAGRPVVGEDGIMYEMKDGRVQPVIGPDGQPFRPQGRTISERGGGKSGQSSNVSRIASNGIRILDQMDSAIDQLEATPVLGAINEGGNVLENVIKRLGGSQLGQLAQGAAGTKAQGLRDRFKTDRQQLIGVVKIAADLPAAMMNSNMEMANWLSSLGDPGTMSATSMRHANQTVRMWFQEAQKEDGSMDRIYDEMERVSAEVGAPPPQRMSDDDRMPSMSIDVHGSASSAPPGWEAEWEYLTPEERERVLR
jgi:hypothetical protein